MRNQIGFSTKLLKFHGNPDEEEGHFEEEVDGYFVV
jgi:hypothetical protein